MGLFYTHLQWDALLDYRDKRTELPWWFVIQRSSWSYQLALVRRGNVTSMVYLPSNLLFRRQPYPSVADLSTCSGAIVIAVFLLHRFNSLTDHYSGREAGLCL